MLYALSIATGPKCCKLAVLPSDRKFSELRYAESQPEQLTGLGVVMTCESKVTKVKKQLVSTGINFHNWSVYLRASASPVFSPELPSAKLSGPQSEAALIGLSLRLSLHQLPTLTESRPSRPSRPSSRTVGVRSLRVANQYLEESKKNDSSPRHTKT